MSMRFNLGRWSTWGGIRACWSDAGAIYASFPYMRSERRGGRRGIPMDRAALLRRGGGLSELCGGGGEGVGPPGGEVDEFGRGSEVRSAHGGLCVHIKHP